MTMRVSAITVRALVEAVGATGVGTQRFLECARLEAERLAQPYGWYSVEEFDALMLLAIELTRDEAFGLHWGEQSLMIQYDVLPALVAHAESLAQAIASVLRFQSVLGDHHELDFHERQGRARFTLKPLAVSPLGARLRTEMLAVGLLRLLNVVGQAAQPTVTRVAFAHACPAHRPEYDRLFGSGRVHFGQSGSVFEFRCAALDARHAWHNEELHRALTAQAERVLTRITTESTHAARVKQYVRGRLPRVPSIPEAARALGSTERSLRRRLAEEGTTYSSLMAQLQVELACELLANPTKSLKEVAVEAGFADADTFRRAFKRWTQTSPARYRAAKLSAPGA